MAREMPAGLLAYLETGFAESHTTAVLQIEAIAGQPRFFYLATAGVEHEGATYTARLAPDGATSVLRQSLGAATDRAELVIADADNGWLDTLGEYAPYLDGARVEIGRLWVNLETGQQWHKVLMRGVVTGRNVNDTRTTLTIANENYAVGAIGGGRIAARECQWVFKGRQCGYTGGEETCNKLYDDAGGCSGRSNQHRYSGFVQLQGVAAISGAAGKSLPVPQPTTEEMAAAAKTLLRWIHVTEDYGADPTGVADSWEAFQRAINASCNGTDNRPVYFAGAFKITRPLTWPTADVDKTMRLFGAGRSSSVIVYTGTGSLFADVGDVSLIVRLASTANVNIANPGTSTFDSTVASSGDRILLKNQSTTSQNGVYVFNGSSSAMTRATDADAWSEFFCQFVTTTAGVTQANKIYRCQADTLGTLGTTAITYQQDRRNDHLCFDGFSVYATNGSNTGNCWDFSNTNSAAVQTGVQVKNCYVQDFGGWGYYARNTQSSVIEGCHFRGQKKGAIAFADNDLGSFAIAPNANRIINNQIDNLNYVNGTSVAAIYLYGGNGTTIQGNTIQGHWFDAGTADLPAIHVSNSNGVLIANNWIESSITNTAAGILVEYSTGTTLVACVGSGLHQTDVSFVSTNGASLHGCSYENDVANLAVDSGCHTTTVFGGSFLTVTGVVDESNDGVKLYGVNYKINDNISHQFKWSDYARDQRPTQLNAVKNGRFLEGLTTNWTSSGATVTLISTGTPPDDTPYILVDVSGGADSSSGGVNFSQAVAIPDTWPAGPVTLAIKFYIESYGVGASNIRYVDIAGSFGTNLRFAGSGTYTHPLDEWRTAYVIGSIGTGTGRTFTARISSTSGNKTPIMRFSDFVLAPGTELARESQFTGTRISERTNGIGLDGRMAMATTSLASPANGDFWYDGSTFNWREGGTTKTLGTGGGGGGTVSSVGLSMPSGFSVAGSPVTTSGTLAVTLASQSAAQFLASPTASSGAPTFRSAVVADISDSTAAGQAILTAANAAAQRTALGLAAVASSGSAADLNTGTLPLARLSGITNTEISASAAIALSKLAAITASRIAISDGSGFLSAADTATYPTLTELAYVKGVTSAIQTQLSAKQALDADLTAIAALAGTSGLLRKTAADTWTLETSTYLTAAGAVTSITGTTNQVTASASVGAVTLSLPQSIHTAATPQFAKLGVGAAISGGELVRVNGSSYNSLLIDSSNTTGPGISISNTGASGRNYALLSTGSAAGIGAGNFGLYDATAGAYRWHVDSSGGMQSGPHTAIKDWGSVSSSNLIVNFTSYGDGNRNTYRRANNTLASPTGLTAGDFILNINGRGWTSAGAFTSSANVAITAFAAEPFTGSVNGTYLGFYTAAIGESVANERLRMHSNGMVGVNKAAPTAQLHVVSSSATVNAFSAVSHASSTVPAAYFDTPSTIAPIQFSTLTSASTYTAGLQPLGVDSTGRVFLHEPILTVNDLGSTMLWGPTDVNEAYAFNWTAKHIWKLGTTAQAAIQLEMTTRTTDGNTDSHYLEWISKHRSSSTDYTGNWRTFADATDNVGTSNLVFRGAVNNTGYVTALTLNQSGDVTVGRGFVPASMADGSAPNNSIYYSTTAGKLVYKTSGGVVNNLY